MTTQLAQAVHWVLVTPALAAANNGNWQTAHRWGGMVSRFATVEVVGQWQDAMRGRAAGDRRGAVGLIALHARRSAASVQAFRAEHPHAPLVLVLTGTDLYRDLASDASAQASLAAATRIVVLNDLGARPVPERYRSRVDVCLQSATARLPLARKPHQHLRAVVVGHLRDEKAPDTVFRAVRELARLGRLDIRLDHIGAPLDAELGAQAQALAQALPKSYRWLGNRSHAEVRRRIQAAHVLVHPSRMEGGAHVVIEAVRSGTPVLASTIDGNLGLLGTQWPASFAVDDASALAGLLMRARDEPAWLAELAGRTQQLSPRFAPEAEAAALRAILERTQRDGEAESARLGTPAGA